MDRTNATAGACAEPLLSVVIPVWRGAERGLDGCLRSIFSQRLSEADLEVIAVDDCSDDGGATRRLLDEWPAVRVLTTPRNMKQGGARNCGVDHARGRFVAFIDQDDTYYPGALAALAEALRHFEGDVMVTDNTEGPGRRLKLGFTDTRLLAPDEFVSVNGPVYAPWRLAMRRSYLRRSGIRFRADTLLEDIDWGLRVITCAEGGVQFLPMVLVHYERHAGSTTAAITDDPQVLGCYLESCRLAAQIPGAAAATLGLVGRSVDWGVQYMFVLPAPASWKAAQLRQLPRGLPYARVTRLLMAFPRAGALLLNAGRPLWQLLRHIYHKRHEDIS